MSLSLSHPVIQPSPPPGSPPSIDGTETDSPKALPPLPEAAARTEATGSLSPRRIPPYDIAVHVAAGERRFWVSASDGGEAQ